MKTKINKKNKKMRKKKRIREEEEGEVTRVQNSLLNS